MRFNRWLVKINRSLDDPLTRHRGELSEYESKMIKMVKKDIRITFVMMCAAIVAAGFTYKYVINTQRLLNLEYRSYVVFDGYKIERGRTEHHPYETFSFILQPQFNANGNTPAMNFKFAFIFDTLEVSTDHYEIIQALLHKETKTSSFIGHKKGKRHNNIRIEHRYDKEVKITYCYPSSSELDDFAYLDDRSRENHFEFFLIGYYLYEDLNKGHYLWQATASLTYDYLSRELEQNWATSELITFPHD
jgi:hypothetical protein